VIVTGVVVVTAFVVTVNVADVFPAAIVTEAGGLADVLVLERVILAPPVGAAAVNVTVPVTDVPPVTLEAFSVTEESAKAPAGVIVRPAVLFTP
jgi:hypothetical protein